MKTLITEQKKIAVWLAILPRTIDNPITVHQIERATKIKDIIVSVIRILREEGKLIASTKKGYYVATCRADFDYAIRLYDRAMRRAHNSLKIAQTLRDSFPVT